MKRKPAGSNHKAIEKFLMDGSASAIDIRRATKVKGNIYQTLNKMVSLGLIKKVGTKYSITLAPETQSKPEPQQAKIQPHPNEAKISVLFDEIEHVSAGIQTLQATLNYLNRRVEQLTEQKF
jgi:hypothetical protein